VGTLIKEIQLFSQQQSNQKIEVDTIYFGGGTPSLLPPKDLELIFKELNNIFVINKNAEITLESNPGTIDRNYLKDYKSIGINRISLGIQSFNDNELKFLQRIHNAQEAIETIKFIRDAKYNNLSIDLIFGLPMQSLEIWENNLKIAVEIQPEHISAYNLIYEEGTTLFKDLQKGKVKQLNEELEETYFYLTSKYLSSNGYQHYEISNFAKINYKSRHNQKYWYHIPYYSFGPSAHSFANNKRYWNIRNLKEYMNSIKQNQLPIESSEVLTQKDILTETIMLQLRAEGINADDFQKKFGIDLIDVIERQFKTPNEYFVIDGKNIKLNLKGYFLINEINLKLITDKIIQKF
jgi:oxygen-independent coproporphyrinogen-3 oxidase